MSTSARLFTEEDLLRMPRDGKRYELVRGELREWSPTGYEHGRCTGNFHVLLGEHVRRRKLGSVLAAETGFILERTEDGKPTVRAADVSFVAAGRIPKDADVTRYLEIPPDVVVETLSPHDSALERREVCRLDARGCARPSRMEPIVAVNHRPPAGRDNAANGRRRARSERRGSGLPLPRIRHLRLTRSSSPTTEAVSTTTPLTPLVTFLLYK